MYYRMDLITIINNQNQIKMAKTRVVYSTKEEFSKEPHPIVKFGEGETNAAVVLCEKLEFNEDCMIIDNHVMHRLLLSHAVGETVTDIAKALAERIAEHKNMGLKEYVKMLQAEVDFYKPIIAISTFLVQREHDMGEALDVNQL